MKNKVVMLRQKMIAKALLDPTHEHCVLCWAKTEILKSTPIE